MKSRKFWSGAPNPPPIRHLQWRIYIVKFWMHVPLLGPIFFIFMQFSAKFGKIIGLYPSPFGLAPLWEIMDPPIKWPMFFSI